MVFVSVREHSFNSSPIAALGGHFLVESRAAGHREGDNGHEGLSDSGLTRNSNLMPVTFRLSKVFEV